MRTATTTGRGERRLIPLDGFLLRAAAAGVGVALIAGPLGCFVIWRRMVYFSDATAHASILGVALALAHDISIVAGVLAVALAAALAVWRLDADGRGADALLGVIAHSTLAVGLVAVSMMPGVRIDLSSHLFGDILAVDIADLAAIWGGAASVAALLAWRWSRLLTATRGPDIASASGIDPRREQPVLVVALAVVVAVAIKVVGALLIGALLLVPAAARRLTATPEAMAAAAAGIGATSAIGGICASWTLDSPTGPSIVCVAAAIYVATLAIRPA